MAVETDGTLRMRGDGGPGITVRVLLDDGRLRLLSGNELVGDWQVTTIGISALNEGFAIRAEGEEFILRAEHDAHLADELGIAAASPRMARKLAALHNPDGPPDEPLVDVLAEPTSNVLAIALALGGLLVAVGGSFLRLASTSGASARALVEPSADGGGDFWLAFVVGGLLMVASGYLISLGPRWARVLSFAVVAGMVALFGWVITRAITDASYLTAYGFIAGGLVVGIAVMFSGALSESD